MYRLPTTKLDPRIVLDDADAPILGNASGDLKIAVFFDYQCPFCRKSEPGLLQIVKDDGQIGLVMKDWPIFGEVSMRMAQLTWSAQRQGRYAELHEALMTTRGRPDQDQLEAIAAQAGLNLDRVLPCGRKSTAVASSGLAQNPTRAAPETNLSPGPSVLSRK